MCRSVHHPPWITPLCLLPTLSEMGRRQRRFSSGNWKARCQADGRAPSHPQDFSAWIATLASTITCIFVNDGTLCRRTESGWRCESRNDSCIDGVTPAHMHLHWNRKHLCTHISSNKHEKNSYHAGGIPVYRSMFFRVNFYSLTPKRTRLQLASELTLAC